MTLPHTGKVLIKDIVHTFEGFHLVSVHVEKITADVEYHVMVEVMCHCKMNDDQLRLLSMQAVVKNMNKEWTSLLITEAGDNFLVRKSFTMESLKNPNDTFVIPMSGIMG